MVGAGSDFVSQVKEKGIKNLSKINVKQVALSGIIGAASGAYGGHGVRHKKSDVFKYQKVYNYAIDGVKKRKWSGSKGGNYIKLAGRKLTKVLGRAVRKTTKKYIKGAFGSVILKKGFSRFTR